MSRKHDKSRGAAQLHYKIAQHGSLAINIILAILQVYAAVGTSTGGDSYSVFATAADAIFDPLSNLNLYFWNRVMNRIDKDNYPGGKSRFENVGNIIFCWIMSAVSAVLIAVSSLEIANTRQIKGPTETGDSVLNIAQIAILCTSIVLKTTFMLICFPLRKRYSQMHTLFADHRNDILVNCFGLFSTVAGRKIAWWVDPAGAIIISLAIIILWCGESVEHFKNLVGVTCDNDFLQQVTHIVLCHAKNDIVAVDTVRAWHSGPRLLVEVDIVMDRNRTLQDTHDIAEDLQMKLERLPDVERAYVHVDYETSHSPEHFLKKVL